MNWLKRMMGRAGRRRGAAKEITEARLQEMFLAAPDTPLWEATLTVIAQQANAVAERAVDPRMSDREVRYHLGGAGALMELKDLLLEYEDNARRIKDEQARESAKQNQ